MQVPAGLSTRPLVATDATAVFELMAAAELHDTGEVAIEEADIVADWQQPSFDVSGSTIGVFDGAQLVGYGEYCGGERCDASVHPAHRGRGIGTAIAAWIRLRAKQAGAVRVGMPVPAGSAGDRLLRALGYDERWQSWILRLPPDRQVQAQPLPDGYEIRAGGTDDAALREVWQVVEDAFLEWSERERTPFPDWRATTVERPGFESWRLRVATEPTGAVVGMALVLGEDHVAYIDKLAVRADHRGLGLGRALLAEAFATAQARGATRMELSTDSRTGALSLYEHVGMEVTGRWVHLAAQLTDEGQ